MYQTCKNIPLVIYLLIMEIISSHTGVIEEDQSEEKQDHDIPMVELLAKRAISISVQPVFYAMDRTIPVIEKIIEGYLRIASITGSMVGAGIAFGYTVSRSEDLISYVNSPSIECFQTYQLPLIAAASSLLGFVGGGILGKIIQFGIKD